MKKKAAWMIGAMLCAGCLWGCGDNTQPTTETTQEMTTTEATTESTTTEATTTEATTTEATEAATQDASEAAASTTLPISEAIDMIFASGAGAWSTELKLNPDGSFSGSYHDSEMGESGDDYPNGSIYVATFTGQFSNIKKVNDYTYSMTLSNVNVEEKEEKIEDGVRYVPSDVYGISGGETFYFYTKDAPVAELSQDFLSWRSGVTSEEQQKSDTLAGYGLYNEKDGDGLFTYE